MFRHRSFQACFAACILCIDAVNLRASAPQIQTDLDSSGSPSPLLSFVFVSSPAEHKVSYAEVQTTGHTAVGGTRALISSYVQQPFGLAYEPLQSALFVADIGREEVLRYKLEVTRTGSVPSYQVVVVGTPLVVVKGMIIKWVAVDTLGNLYYTGAESGTINRLSALGLKQIVDKVVGPTDMATVTAQENILLAEATASEQLHSSSHHAKRGTNSVVTLYEQGVSPHVSSPRGIVTSGNKVYWVNGKDGQRVGDDGLVIGSLAAGWTDPASHVAATGYSSTAVASNSPASVGVAACPNSVVFSDGAQNVFAMTLAGHLMTLADTFDAARGIVWDGDGSLYVADSTKGGVFALPCGAPAAPQKVIDLPDATGIAVMKRNAVAFTSAQASETEIAEETGQAAIMSFVTDLSDTFR